MGARAQIRALALAGALLPSQAAAEVGCSDSYARRIYRELEREGIQAKPLPAFDDSASSRVRAALVDAGGGAASAAELADAAACSVAYARKVLAVLGSSERIASLMPEATGTDAERFTAREWRATSLGASFYASDRQDAESHRLECEAEAHLTRRSALADVPFDLF